MTEVNDIDLSPEPSPRALLKPFLFALLSIVLVGLMLGGYGLYLNTPMPVTDTIVVSIEEGDSVPLITQKLQAAGVVRSSTLLYFILVTEFDPTKIKASRYVFDTPLSTHEIAARLITGDFDTDLTSITIFEGESREKMAARLSGSVSWFESNTFLTLTIDREGQLFPDTYFIPQEYTTENLVVLLHRTYEEVLADYETAIDDSQLSTNEVITLASIVEREANTVGSMKLVAGIFLNRLAIDMPLQADASIEYVLEHDLNELAPGELAQNLREFDSPYNTYLYAGLPPSPIGNPGRDAIEAVLYPTRSEYLYYLTGNDGVFYYAETYQEHLVNIDRHLK